LFGQDPGSPLAMLPMLAILGLMFYFILLRPQRSEARARQEMLKSLKKNDRVITAGGIYGVITSIQPDADEVTIKVDESTNTKLRLTLNSITRRLGDSPAEGDKEAK
jgi:preprotein translocase subunit YajC